MCVIYSRLQVQALCEPMPLKLGHCSFLFKQHHHWILPEMPAALQGHSVCDNDSNMCWDLPKALLLPTIHWSLSVQSAPFLPTRPTFPPCQILSSLSDSLVPGSTVPRGYATFSCLQRPGPFPAVLFPRLTISRASLNKPCLKYITLSLGWEHWRTWKVQRQHPRPDLNGVQEKGEVSAWLHRQLWVWSCVNLGSHFPFPFWSGSPFAREYTHSFL